MSTPVGLLQLTLFMTIIKKKFEYAGCSINLRKTSTASKTDFTLAVHVPDKNYISYNKAITKFNYVCRLTFGRRQHDNKWLRHNRIS